MAPDILHPGHWLAAIDNLSRLPAILVLLLALSMLVLGLRAFEYYVRLYAALGGWLGGTMLADLMRVSGWYVGLPAALIALAIIWPLSRYAAPVVSGFISGCGLGALVANGLQLGGFWVAFAIGLFAGVALAVLASRFTIALLSAACGTMAAVAALGAAVRAPSGWLAPGGYVDFPVIYIIVGAFLFVAALIAQVMLDQEASRTGWQDD